MKDDSSESTPGSALAGALLAAAPDLAAAEEHRRRKELVRQRLLGSGPPRIGRFTLLREVGSGAMSKVYAAYDEELDRQVAVKLLRSPMALADQRLRREAQALAKLSHPNVVAVYDTGTWEGRFFIAMEFVKGQTLDAWLDADRRTWQQIVEVFLEAGRGLAAAHAQGLVHRDFKPTNVMIGEDGRARVLDFGLVRLAEEAGAPEPRGEDQVPLELAPEGSGSLTATGAAPGTPAYMAPEQHAGGVADARSDQFSFCKALYEALSGVRPGEDRAANRGRRTWLIRPRLSRVIERGLEEEPGARWPSMRHLLGALERVRWPARRWRSRAAVLGMAGLVAVVAVTAWQRIRTAQRERAALEQQGAHQHALAQDARLVEISRRLNERDPTVAVAPLLEIQDPAEARGLRSLATALLLEPLSSAVTRGLDAHCLQSAFDRSGGRVTTLLEGGGALTWRADGAEAPVRLRAEPGSTTVLSADGEWVLTFRSDAPEAILSRTDGSLRRALGEPSELVASATLTGDGAEVVTVSGKGVVRRWRSGRSQVLGTPPRELGIRDPSRWTFNLGPAGRHVIGLAPDGARWTWRADATGPAVRVTPPDHPRLWVRLSPDERWVVTVFEDGDVELRDVDAGGPPVRLHGHTDKVLAIDFSPDGRSVATASADGTARVWRTDGRGDPVVLRGHTKSVASVRFDPEGRRLATISYDRTARVWSLDDGDVMVLRGHSNTGRMVAFSPDGRKVVTCGSEPALRLWDVSRRPVRVLGRHNAKIWSAKIDRDGRRLVTAGFDGTARIWYLDGARPPVVLRGDGDPRVYTAVFSPDGKLVATGSGDGTARIWSADGTGKPIVLPGHHEWVYGMAFSPDGRWLATGARDGEVRISPTDGRGPARILVPGCTTRVGGRVHSLLFSPRGDRIATDAHGCTGGPALLWTDGERPPAVLGSRRATFASMAMGPDGRVAISEIDGTLRVWGVDGGGPPATLRGHEGAVHDLTFSRDGRLLSASFDGSARIWDLEHPGEPVILRGHEDWVLHAAFDAAERRVVTASSDDTARVWRLDEPDQPIVLRGHEDDVRFAGFTPEGRVVTASFDGTVRLWSLDALDADAPALMAQLRQATNVCLTADQRMQYLDEPAATAHERFAACERAAGRAP